MIVNERFTDYLHSLEESMDEVLEKIGQEARSQGVPIIRPETGALLRTLIHMKKPMKVLEVGTATGYSAIMMSECLPEGAGLVTIENYEKRITAARENIRKAGMQDVITLIEGDALKVLPDLESGFDFIFMDAAKAQYINMLDDALRLLSPGGVLISDNVLQDGDIIESRFAVTRRNRTIHKRMRDYLWKLKHMPELETAVLTVGDGLTVSVKKQ